MLEVMSQVITKKAVEAPVEKEVRKITKKDIGALNEAYNSALAELNKKLEGTGKKVSTIFDLEKMMKEDKKLKKEFFEIYGKKLQELGFQGDAETLGKTAFKTIAKYKRAEDYGRVVAGNLLGESVDKVSDQTIAKLQNLFDKTAKQFGMDPIKFYYKYCTDAKFAKLANAKLIEEIRSDPELAQKLGNARPDEVMHALADIKAANMSWKDKAAFILRELPRTAPVEFLKASTVSFGAVAQQMISMPSLAVLNSVPHLSGMALMTMYNVQQYSQLYVQNLLNTSFKALRNPAQPQIFLSYASAEQLRQQLAEASKAGLGNQV